MKWGFSGHPVGRSIERPFGMVDYVEAPYYGDGLPLWVPTGWRLVRLAPPTVDPLRWDPYVLYDRWDNILYVWEQEDPPPYVDVLEVCTKLLAKPS